MEKPFSAYRGDGPYVFVCYAHEDSEAVFREIAWLNDYGVNVWYDEGISPGHEWREELAAAIQGCSRMLFFVSPRSVVSEHCRRELNFAQEENREVIAIHLEPTEMPGGLRLGLNNRQAILKRELSEEEFHKRLMRAAQGVGSPTTAPTSTSVARSPRRKAGMTLATLALVAVAVGTWWLLTRDAAPAGIETAIVTEEEPAPEVLPNSIAVLPFDNQSPDPNNAYFAAGIHEEILNQLVKIKDLSVIARTTMLRYVDSDKSIPEIGRELNVGTVMEGSVRYAGNRVRITAQLIDTNSGAHLWSEAYEEELEDIFGIQLAIATQIARTLQAEFSPSEMQRVSSQITTNPEAYAHYLRALSIWGNFAPTEPVHQALNDAIGADPSFATAIAYKAWVHGIEATFGRVWFGPSFNADAQWRFIALAEQYAQRALEIDKGQALAHVAMSTVHGVHRNWDADLASMERAYSLSPNDYRVVQQTGWRYAWNGRIDEGIELARRAVELNPGDIANIWNFGQLLYVNQRFEEMKRQAQIVVAAAPDQAFGYVSLVVASLHLGDAEAVQKFGAMAEARKPGAGLSALAFAYGQIGDAEAAERVSRIAQSELPSGTLHPSDQFWLHMATKDYELAIRDLETVIANGFPAGAATMLHFNSEHPDFDAIRDHEQFQDLVRRAGLPIQSAGGR